MKGLEDFTLIVPTHNRHEKFASLVNVLGQFTEKINIIILDSSSDEIKNKNKMAAKCALKKNVNYSYCEFESHHEPFEKFYFGISRVNTAYCAMCADDDIPLLESVKEIISFLAVNPDYIAAHGYYFDFQVTPEGFEIQDVTYYMNNLLQENKMERVHSLFSNYEAVFYATFRTECMKKFFSLALAVDTTLWKELILALAAVMSGKIYRTPRFYYGRRVGGSLPFNNWHPHEIFSKKPDLYFTDYSKCRTALLEHFGVTQEEEKKLFDLSHLFYLKKYLDPQTLQAYCNEPYQKSQSKEGIFYKEQQMRADSLQKAYTSRKTARSPLRLAISMGLRELLLSLGYAGMKRFSFLKPAMKKIGVHLVPNTVLTNTSNENSNFSYNFGSEFFLRNLPRGSRPNKDDISFIISNMENYIEKEIE